MTSERKGITRWGVDRRAILPHPSEPISSWLNHVKRNHGGSVSERTVRAVSRFYFKLKFQFTTLFNKILVLNPIVPDSIEAALTPLIDVTNNFRWIDYGQGYKWGNGENINLTIDGIANKTINYSYIDTQFNPSLYITSPTDAGVTTYISESPGTDYDQFNGYFFGCAEAPNPVVRQAFRFQFKYSRDWMDYPNTEAGAGNHFTNTYGGVTEAYWQRGFLSFNQSGAAVGDNSYAGFEIWKASEFFPLFDDGYKPYGNGPVAPTDTLPNLNAYFLSYNNNNSYVAAGPTRSNDRYSFLAIHKALTSGEASDFYNLIFELRVNLGGGARRNF